MATKKTEEEKKEGLMVIDMERTTVRVLDGSGSLDDKIVKAFFKRLKDGKGDIDTTKIDTYLYEIRWETEGDVVKEAHNFLQQCEMPHIAAVTAHITDRIEFDDPK